jgi:hypothetical protein
MSINYDIEFLDFQFMNLIWIFLMVKIWILYFQRVYIIRQQSIENYWRLEIIEKYNL